jgi:hypothetical protein
MRGYAGNAPLCQPEALAGLTQRVRVSIQPPVLADGVFQQRAEDRRQGCRTDLPGLVRGRAGTSESGET